MRHQGIDGRKRAGPSVSPTQTAKMSVAIDSLRQASQNASNVANSVAVSGIFRPQNKQASK